MKKTNFIRLLVLMMVLITCINTAWAADDDTRTVFLDISGCSWYLNNDYTPRIWVSKNDAKNDTYEIDYEEIVATNVYRFEIDKGARCIQFLRYKSSTGDKQNWSGDIWINSDDSKSACCYKYHNYFKLDNNAATVADANKTSFASTGEYLYFYGNNLTTTTAVQFVMGRWNHYATTNMSLLTNTEKLYYCTGASYSDSYSYFSIMGNGSSWDSNSKGFNDIISYASDYTAAKYGYKFNSGSTYYATKSSTSKGSAVSIESKSGYSAIPKNTTTLNIKVREATGGAYSNGSTSDKPAATIKITGTYLSGNGTTGRSDATWTTGNSCSYETVISGKVTPTYETLDGDWQFDGWYIGGSSQGTGTSFDFFQTSETTVEARFTRLKYDITLNNHGATSAGTGSVKATYGATTNLTSNISVPSKTGYTFGGYYTGENGTGTQLINASGAWQTGNSWINASTEWIYTSDVTLHAKWTANPYVITLTQSGETGYGSAGTASVTATYDVTMPAIGSVPTGTTGYKFQGYYSGHNGTGSKVVNADGTWNDVTDTISSGKWVRANTLTLYAYFQKAQVTSFTFDPETAAGDATVTVTPTITPASPEGTTYICWGLFKDEDCTHEVDGVTFKLASDGTSPADPSISPNAVQFTTPEASGVYYVRAIYRTGGSCGDAEDVLNVYKQSYIVASDHTVTVRYMCDGVAIHAPTEVEVPAASTSESFSALSGDDVFGYEFSSWTIGDGVTIETGSTSTSTIAISATFNGVITANYTPKKIIYFKNTLNWSGVYVNLSQIDYWDSGTKGSGNENNHHVANQAMTLVPGETNIYYYEYTNITNYVSFTSSSQSNAKNFWGKNPPVNVVYPTRPDATGSNDVNRGFYSAVPMFVPVSGQTGQDRNAGDGGKAIYYDKGHWSKYDAIQHKTGYKLIVYNKPENSSRRTEYELDMTESSTNHGFAEVTIDLEGSHKYGIKIQRADGKVYTFTSSADMGLYESSSYTVLDQEANSTYQAAPMQSTTAGDYTFKLACDASTGKLKIGVKKPAASGDYRVVYSDDTHNTAAKKRFSRTITKQANAEDIVSFYVDVTKHPAMTFEYISGIAGGTVTWADGSDLTISSIKTSGVYNFYLKQNGSGVISLDKIEPYDGDFYIRTDAVGGTKWADYRNTAHQMTYSDYAAANEGYTHYWMKHIEGASNTNVKFVVANDYSAWISDTVIQQSPEVAHIDAYGNNTGDVSIRFSYNKNTNVAKRTYLANSTADNFLVLKNNATASTNKVKVGGVDKSGVDVKFNDNQDYIYDITAQVVPSANVKVKVFAHYNTTDQDLVGLKAGGWDIEEGEARQLLSGTGDALQSIRILYDFKTNRIVTAWLPASEIVGTLTINADLMIVREHQGSAQNIILKHDDESGKDGSLTTNKRIYGVMRFNRWTLNNLSNANDKDPDHAEESSSDPDYYLNHHSSLSPAQQLPTYQRNLYYISFPFDVNVSDIFGFGKYGTHYAIQRYDGAGRAKNGYWIDSEPNWKWVAPNGKLNAYEGYVLSLSLSNMAADKFDVWANRTSEVELYFPSTTEETITISDADITIPALDIEQYTCTITRDNRNIKDSYWRCIGVPSYADFSAVLEDSENNDITWVTSGDNLPYLYDINWQDKSLTPYAGKNFNFKAMHSYLVQYGGSITWKNVVNKPAAIVAREKTADSEYSFRLELSNNEQFCDQTYVRMTDKEGVTAGFDFDQDMWKQVYSTRSNIYTKIGDVEVAGNTMPMSEQTTVVPVGVKIAADGDYTFAMPDGTSGVGVTLIDNEAGIRTSLNALNYTINLSAGDYTDRFFLEISPIQQMPMGVEEVTGDGLQVTGARKVMIDGLLYIVKDGKMFDAQGRQVK